MGHRWWPGWPTDPLGLYQWSQRLFECVQYCYLIEQLPVLIWWMLSCLGLCWYGINGDYRLVSTFSLPENCYKGMKCVVIIIKCLCVYMCSCLWLDGCQCVQVSMCVCVYVNNYVSIYSISVYSSVSVYSRHRNGFS